MADYKDLIETAIQKQIELTNRDVALRQVRKVPDLDVTDDGTVTAINGPGKRVLDEVVAVYSELMGDVAESLIAYAIRDKYNLDKFDLPENLESHL